MLPSRQPISPTSSVPDNGGGGGVFSPGAPYGTVGAAGPGGGGAGSNGPAVGANGTANTGGGGGGGGTTGGSGIVIIKENAVALKSRVSGVFNISEVYDLRKSGDWTGF